MTSVHPWYFTSGGGETGVYKSSDGGETWEKLSGKGNGRGLPEGDMDRVGLAVHRDNPDIVYVISETKTEGELWRTDDSGRTWRTVNRDPNINFRPFYYSDVRVDPKNPNVVYTLSGGLYKSDDGGRTFSQIRADIHGDHQAMVDRPHRPQLHHRGLGRRVAGVVRRREDVRGFERRSAHCRVLFHLWAGAGTHQPVRAGPADRPDSAVEIS